MQDRSFSEDIGLYDRAVTAANWALDNWFLWPILLFLLWLFLYLKKQHHILAELDERADAAFADVDALLAERHGLISNLAETVRAYAKTEREVVTDVLLSRVDAIEALDGGSMMMANQQFANSLQNLFTLADKFPQLTQQSDYKELRAELIRIEEKVTASRKFYNMSVEELNAVSRTFPAGLFAGMMGIKVREKFSLGERREDLQDPTALQL
ncbi:LemA family protein [Sphingomicrobium flavum]|uniref:LemA family protein n=1 Tax=Sphingomicrobium flavum TaxID=1229164 RepID=UPI0021AE0874|nr:LemA family protein [Sphingomicrobium flavum]